MTHAAGIEIGTAPRPAIGGNGLPRGTHDAAETNAWADSSAGTSGPASFRSGWEALLQNISGNSPLSGNPEPTTKLSEAAKNIASSGLLQECRTTEKVDSTKATAESPSSGKAREIGPRRLAPLAPAAVSIGEPAVEASRKIVAIAAPAHKSVVDESSTVAGRSGGKRARSAAAATCCAASAAVVIAPVPVVAPPDRPLPTGSSGAAVVDAVSIAKSSTYVEQAAGAKAPPAGTAAPTSQIDFGADSTSISKAVVIAPSSMAANEASEAHPSAVVDAALLTQSAPVADGALIDETPRPANTSRVTEAPSVSRTSRRVGEAPAVQASTVVQPSSINAASAAANPDVSAPHGSAEQTIPLDPKSLRAGKTGFLRSERSSGAISTRSVGQTVHGTGAFVHDEAGLIQMPDRVEQNGVNPALIRDQAGMAGNANGQQLSLATPPAHAAGINGHDPFAALDAETTSPGTSWIHAGAHRAEAGYLDPSLGWVGVRAQAGGGGVHATVLPGSAEAAQALSGHLSGLNTYLAEHHGEAATVTMESPRSEHSSLEMGLGQGQGTSYGSSQQENAGRQEAYAGKPAGAHSAASERSSQVSMHSAEAAGQGDGIMSIAVGRGTHISVVA